MLEKTAPIKTIKTNTKTMSSIIKGLMILLCEVSLDRPFKHCLRFTGVEFATEVRLQPNVPELTLIEIDFRPANILLKLQCLDGLDEEEVIEMLGKPETTKVRVRKSPSSTPAITGAPDYLVYPVDYDDADPSLISTEAYVTDFGQSFDISEDALPTSSGIPADYRAPEMVLSQTAGIEMDLWSLGCTLFEIRTGRRLFSVFQLLRFDGAAYLLELAPLLGKPPEAWLVPWKKKLRALLSGPDGDSKAEPSINTIKSEAARCRAIEEEIEASIRCTGEDCAHGPHEPISGDEARIFSDLLEKLLRWIPEERLASSKVLEHEWFKT